MFDQYLSARMLDRYPRLYENGQKSKFYNHKGTKNKFVLNFIIFNIVFWFWIVNCFYHSLFIFASVAAIYGESVMIDHGLVADNWLFGI